MTERRRGLNGGSNRIVGTGAPPPDEHWQWDGERWQYDGDPAADAAPPPPDDGTGQWVWDGTQWQPVVG